MKLSSVLILLLINFFSPQYIPRGVENPQSGLTIEIMSTTSQKEAAALTEQLRAKVVDAYWIAVTAPGQETSYRVRIGWYGSNFAARRSADLWQSEGLFRTYVIKAWEPPNTGKPKNDPSGNTVTNRGNDGSKAEAVSQTAPALSTKANVAPELIVQAGHSSDVKSVAFSRDGKWLVSGSADKTIKLWEVKSGREIRSFTGHTASINSVAFSPDGTRIVSASEDETVRLWDARTGSETFKLPGRFSSNVQVAFSPDGKQLASTSGTVHLWNAQTGAEVKRLSDYFLTAVAYSPNGKYLAGTINQTGYQPERIVLWDAQTGAEVRAFTGHYLPITSIAFSWDSRFMVSATRDTIKVWEVGTGKELRTFTQRRETINSVAFSPDGKRIASGTSADGQSISTPTIKLWEIETGAERTLEGHYFWVYSVAFSPDGKQLASGSRDTTIKLWDVETTAEKITIRHGDLLTSFSVVPDGKHLASYGRDNIVKLWNVDNGLLARTFQGHLSRVSALDFAPDGKQMASGDEQGGIKLWNSATGAEIKTLAERGAGRIEALVFAPDGGTIATSYYRHNTIQLWEVKTGALKTIENAGQIYALAFSPDGKQIASAGKAIRIWDVQRRAEIKTLTGDPDFFTAAAFSPNGKQIVTGGWDKTVRVWEVESGKILHSFQEESPINSVSFSPDGRYVVSAANQAKVAKVWDVITGKAVRKLGAHPDRLKAATFSPDGQYIASGSEDGEVKLWNASATKEKTLGGDSSSITTLALSPDGKLLATGTNWELGTNRKGYAIKLWHTETGGLIKTLEHSAYVTSVAFSPDKRYLVAASNGGGILLWGLETGDAPRILTPHGNSGIGLVMFSRDSKELLFPGGKLNIETGTVTSLSATYEGNIYSMASSPNGRQIAAGGDGKIILSDTATGARIDEFVAPHYSLKINSVAFSPDGAILAGTTGSSYQGNVYLWNVKTRQLFKSIDRQSNLFDEQLTSFHTVAVSPDGKHIVVGSGDASLTLMDAATGREIRLLTGHTAPVKTVAFLSDGKYIISGSLDRKTKVWDVETGKELLTLVSFDEGNWVVVTPEGRFDTNKLDDPQGLHWLLPDAPFTPASFEVFMRDYYEPRLLSRILAGEKLKPVRNLQSLNRVQPEVSNISVSAPDTTGVVTVTLDVANQTSDSQRDATGKLLTSGVYDVRLFRDGQLVGYTTTEDAPLDATDEKSLAVWRKANEVPLMNGKKRLSFRVTLPRAARKQFVEFSAYAFNADRVKSETFRTEYKIPATLTPVKGRAYVITLSTNAYENPTLNLRFAANDGRQVQRELVKRLLARGEYSEVVGIPLLSDYEVRRGTRVIPALDASAEDLRLGQQTVTEKSATKAIFKAVLSLLAGKSVPTTQLAGIPNVEKLRAARPEDVIIVHVSGHGYSDDAGRFFLVPYDSGTGTLSALLTRSISSDELSWWLRDIDAGDLTLITDACQSAAAVAGQGFKPGPMGSRGLGQLAYDKGMRVLAATQADNVALGHGSIKQGLLTYALMHEGLELGLADYKPVDKTILLSEWLVYATERVPQLFEDVLRGQMRSRNPLGSSATTTAETKILVYPQTGNTTEQRILLQGKPLNPNKPASNEGQIQRPALFDFARQRRDVILMR